MKQVLLLLFSLLLFACGPLNISDIQTMKSVPSVVFAVEDQNYMRNNYSLFYDSSINELKSGSCGLASFTVDYSNQSVESPPYKMAMQQWQPIPLSPFEIITGGMNDAYNDTILNMNVASIVDYHLFLTVKQNIPSDAVYDYELLCNKDSIDKNNVVTMFLKTKMDTYGVDTLSQVTTYSVFDISSYVAQKIEEGEDSIVTFNLKYLRKITTKGDLLYSAYSGNPVKILLK